MTSNSHHWGMLTRNDGSGARVGRSSGVTAEGGRAASRVGVWLSSPAPRTTSDPDPRVSLCRYRFLDRFCRGVVVPGWASLSARLSRRVGGVPAHANRGERGVDAGEGPAVNAWPAPPWWSRPRGCVRSSQPGEFVGGSGSGEVAGPWPGLASSALVQGDVPGSTDHRQSSPRSSPSGWASPGSTRSSRGSRCHRWGWSVSAAGVWPGS